MNYKVVTGSLLVLFNIFVTTNAATSDSAGTVVKNTAESVIERLTAEKEVLENHPERIFDLINELVIPHFDFSSMSRWVLGANWKKASEQQRNDFVEQFKTLLVRTYAKALLEYSEEEINYLPGESNPKSNLVTIKTEVKSAGAGDIIPINYRMHISKGQWKVVDVSVDGISLVSTYRGSFASEIKKNGLDALIVKLTERNEKLASTITN